LGLLNLHETVHDQGFGHDVFIRIQARVRVLKNELHMATKGAQILVAHLSDVISPEHDAASRQRNTPQDRTACRALP
jgi:hypothetical protein